MLTGDPNTPNERLCGLLDKLQHEIHSLPSDVLCGPALRKLADEAALIATNYDSYLDNHSSPALSIVQRMIDRGAEVNWDELLAKGETQFRLIPEMSAGGYEAVVLCHFARMAKARTVLEVGMFTGTTTVSLASVPGVEKVVTLELEAYLEKHNRPYFEEAGVADKIDIRIGDAMTTLSALAKENASFDMIFIDADKPNYKNYFVRVLELNLLSKGGFIAVDNTAYKASPWAPDAKTFPMGCDILEFNKIVRDDDRVEEVLLPIRDGITLIRRKGE
ncbi:S-adenosyl-L-methionine-dependent methyltransferase [Peniophora sp. CONT]|nr:S-adenosyl-L-methionine-dependent methyltransferase [Peniophora sp. CONT]